MMLCRRHSILDFLAYRIYILVKVCGGLEGSRMLDGDRKPIALGRNDAGFDDF